MNEPTTLIAGLEEDEVYPVLRYTCLCGAYFYVPVITETGYGPDESEIYKPKFCPKCGREDKNAR